MESGHHGDLWLDFELLRLRPRLVQPAAVELAERLSVHGVDAVCGPLVEGAFVGLLVAAELDVDFSYSERFAQPAEDGLFPAGCGECRFSGAGNVRGFWWLVERHRSRLALWWSVTLQIIWRDSLHAIWRTLRVWTNWRGLRKRPGNSPLIGSIYCDPTWRMTVR